MYHDNCVSQVLCVASVSVIYLVTRLAPAPIESTNHAGHCIPEPELLSPHTTLTPELLYLVTAYHTGYLY